MAVAERGISHGMRYQARALAAQTAEKERSCWLAGTTALREENEVELLEFDSDTDVLRRTGSFWHKAEVWAIAPSPEDPRDFITVHNDGGTYGATLWRMAPNRGELEARAQLGTCDAGVMHAALWQEGGAAVTLEDGRLRRWQLAEGCAEVDIR